MYSLLGFFLQVTICLTTTTRADNTISADKVYHYDCVHHTVLALSCIMMMLLWILSVMWRLIKVVLCDSRVEKTSDPPHQSIVNYTTYLLCWLIHNIIAMCLLGRVSNCRPAITSKAYLKTASPTCYFLAIRSTLKG